MPGKRTRWVVGLAVPGLLLGAAVFSSFIGDEERGRPIRNTVFPNQPIPGERVSLERAASRVPYSIPVLPSEKLNDPCDGASSEVSVLAVWASTTATSREDRRTGMNYSHGIWVSISPISGLDAQAQAKGELRPVEEAFSKDDYPEGLRTGGVRGHVAWIKDLSAEFSCESTGRVGVDAPHGESAAPGSPSSTSKAIMYDPTQIASLNWAEQGVVVELVGPYSAETLSELAQGITWHSGSGESQP